VNILISDPQQIELIRAIEYSNIGAPYSNIGYLVVDGEYVVVVPAADLVSAYFGSTIPPSPWSDLPATCQTCQGHGSVYLDEHGTRWGNLIASGLALPVTREPCPDCVAGRPVHLLQATCRGVRDGGSSDAHEYGGHCPACGVTDRVDLGRFIIQALPVVAHAMDADGDCVVGGHFVGREGIHPLDLDPEPLPGQFVVALTRVTS
jgi:hypothetical protein